MRPLRSVVALLFVALTCAACTGTVEATVPSTPRDSSPSSASPTPSPEISVALPFDGDCAALAQVAAPQTMLGSGFHEGVQSSHPDPAAAAWWNEFPRLRPEATIGGTSCRWTADTTDPPAHPAAIVFDVSVIPRASASAVSESPDWCGFIPQGEGTAACLVSTDSGEWWITANVYLAGDDPSVGAPVELGDAIRRIAEAIADVPVADPPVMSGWWTLPTCSEAAAAVGRTPLGAGWEPDPTDTRGAVLRAEGAYEKCAWASATDAGYGGTIEIAPGAAVRWDEIVEGTSLRSRDVAGADAATASSSPNGYAVVVARVGVNVLLVSASSVDEASDAVANLLDALRGGTR